MKRHSVWFAAALLAVLLVLVTACAKSQPVALGEKDSGRTEQIAVGQELTVQLPSNRTTGFQWTVASSGPVTQVGESVYVATQTAGAVGAGGTETFTFKGATAGSGELELEYHRPWEKDVPAEKTWGVSIVVK